MRLIVGLGNPGREYELTRHNIGFMLIERLARDFGISCSSAGHGSLWGTGRVAAEDAILVMPQTFMNLSGNSVAWFMENYPELKPGSLIVAYDDCDLPLGRLRIRRGGGSGGHRGVDSIIRRINDSAFPRIRLGIGRPAGDEALADYVLSPFTKDEMPVVEELLERAASSIAVMIKEGVDAAMNRFNS